MDTHQKAQHVNLDTTKYGVFAEIGAGQEVARWFFRVGGAAGTIAKTISAYDMTFSDSIYGPCDRYVSRQRLERMLQLEYDGLVERLGTQRGSRTGFFAFANTVAALSFSRTEDTHGWMGVRFQTAPGAEPSQIVIHLRLLDRDNLSQQEVLGIMGVNLVYGALNLHESPGDLMASLLDNLHIERAEVDLIRFSGPAFHGVDNRVMAVELVRRGLTNAAMIAADGEVVPPGDVLRKKTILLMRGSFRPVTKPMVDMLECALAQFVQQPGVQGEEVVTLLEMTLNNLLHGDRIDHEDFLARADILHALGKNVMISNYGLYFRLAEYLFSFTRKMIGITMGVPTLREIFEEKYYGALSGGILESFGRLFENDLKIYVYPQRDTATGALITAENLLVTPHLRHLYAYLLENRFIESLRGFNADYLPYYAGEVLSKIASSDRSWEEMVPHPVAEIIAARGLWGCPEAASLKPAPASARG